MKKILVFVLAAIMLVCSTAVVASAAAGDVAVAVPATDYIPAIDGAKDDVYESSTPLVIENGDISGKAYFAYDNEYLYVFMEVNDGTIPASATGNITPASHTDSAMICINLLNKPCNTSVWNSESVKDNNYWMAIYGVMRTAKNSNQVYEGGHAHLNKGYKSAAIASVDGYSAEMQIPFGADFSGNTYNVADFIANGISVEFAISDADSDTEAVKDTEVVWHVSSGAEKFKMVVHNPYDSDEAVKMHKLEFTAGEFKADRAEGTTVQRTSPTITVPTVTPPVVIITPTVEITTPVATTPAETTPVVTPASTTAAATTPAETTPAETTPAETTPAETTADVSQPEPAEESSPVVLVVVIAVVAAAIGAVAAVLILKKGKKA